MNGLLLMLPFLLIRFGLLAFYSREGLGRAAHFAPVRPGLERAAYLVYQVSNLALFVTLAFLRVSPRPLWLMVSGLVVYGLGLLACAASVSAFARPDAGGFSRKGVYRLSRHPMYVSYFLIFLGCVILTQSLILLMILIIFQAAAHIIILAEERWCLDHFGGDYREYMKNVRRYL